MIDEKDQVVSELDNLRQQSSTGVGGDSPRRGVVGGVATCGGEEVTFLKAENAALQKSLQCKSMYSSDILLQGFVWGGGDFPLQPKFAPVYVYCHFKIL